MKSQAYIFAAFLLVYLSALLLGAIAIVSLIAPPWCYVMGFGYGASIGWLWTDMLRAWHRGCA